MTASFSCFVSQEDNDAWILVFFFIPVGIALLIGFACFFIAIVKILVAAIKLRKPQLLLNYFRLLCFIFIFLFIYSFIFSYHITIASNASTINEGYGVYFDCLLDPYLVSSSGTCSLSDSVSNYNLTMLKAFAICCLGLFLFFTFMTWEIMHHWYLLFKVRSTPLSANNMLFSPIGCVCVSYREELLSSHRSPAFGINGA